MRYDGGVHADTVLVLGVGNPMRQDDGVGPYVARALAADECLDVASARRIVAIDCGITPENHTSAVRRLRPTVLLIVDAADMGLEPGQFRIIPAERVGLLGLSTHSMPLSLFMDYVQDIAGTVVLVGVQPRTMSFGEGLSPEIVVAGDTLAGLVRTGQVETLEILS